LNSEKFFLKEGGRTAIPIFLTRSNRTLSSSGIFSNTSATSTVSTSGAASASTLSNIQYQLIPVHQSQLGARLRRSSCPTLIPPSQDPPRPRKRHTSQCGPRSRNPRRRTHSFPNDNCELRYSHNPCVKGPRARAQHWQRGGSDRLKASHCQFLQTTRKHLSRTK